MEVAAEGKLAGSREGPLIIPVGDALDGLAVDDRRAALRGRVDADVVVGAVIRVDKSDRDLFAGRHRDLLGEELQVMRGDDDDRRRWHVLFELALTRGRPDSTSR